MIQPINANPSNGALNENLAASWEVSLPLISELNVYEHWFRRCARVKRQKLIIKKCWLAYIFGHKIQIKLPCRIVMTRLAPKLFDDDNNVGAFKHVRDQLADCLLPGQRPGMADSDPRIKWEYAQVKQKKKGIRIEIYT